MKPEVPPTIAIIGSACRFPGKACSPSKLWELLQHPRDLLREVPADRFRWEGFFRPDGLYGATKTKHGYFLEENIRQFDPQFFGISPSEAATIDPQHRILLENVYEAIESAGLTLEELRGSDTGVFVGQMSDEYNLLANSDSDACTGQMLTTGSARSITANRISYTFDFRGPSVSLDTACSSSMVAVHLAVQSLRQGESAISFACGVSLDLSPLMTKALTKMNMISSDGRSKMFDEAADGYGRGEGSGVICLKRLDAAIQDGDHIECVIRETGINHDGRTMGITMPSAEAQAKLIRTTYNKAGLDLSQEASRPYFFEAHGTGTPAGDPIEAEAIDAAFYPSGKDYSTENAIYVGSIKTIIGHTEGAAGIAGLLRTALAVQHGIIPPNLLFQRMAPNVAPWTKHLRIACEATLWPSLPEGCPRRASINSFGFGGTNVHVILESYDGPHTERTPVLMTPNSQHSPLFTPFVFSGVSRQALESTLENHLSHLLACNDQISPRDLAWTLQYRRSQFKYRYGIAASSHEELVSELRAATDGTYSTRYPEGYVCADEGSTPQILGVFTGQGAQYAVMGKEILESSEYACGLMDKLDEALATLPVLDRPKWKIKDELLLNATNSRVGEALLSQPLTTAIQILLVQLLQLAGVRLSAVIGHSSGEIGAAYAAGIISAEDAIRNAYYRGLHSKLAVDDSGKAGAMLAAFMSWEEAANFCDLPKFQHRIVLAVINSPSIVTLSGDEDAITEAASELEQKGIWIKRLQVERAYHSHHMQRCERIYKESLCQCGSVPATFQEGPPTWFSSVHPDPGKRMTSVDDSYWAQNLTDPVAFSDAFMTIVSEEKPNMIIEIGPHPTLEKPIREMIASMNKDVIYTGILKRGTNAVKTLSETYGMLWSHFGRKAIDFAKIDKELPGGPQPKFVKDLPLYHWKHDQEFWSENRRVRTYLQANSAPNELLGPEIETSSARNSEWRHFLCPKELPWLLDHKVNGSVVLPGAAYVALTIAATQRKFQTQSIEKIEVTNIRIQFPVVFINDEEKVEIIIRMQDVEVSPWGARSSFLIDFSDSQNTELTTAALGQLDVSFGTNRVGAHLERFARPSNLTDVDPRLFYNSASQFGFDYTGPFRNLLSIKRKIDYATGEINLPLSELLFHPALLDGLFHASFLAEGYPGDSNITRLPVPSIIRRIAVFPMEFQDILRNGKSVDFEIVKTGAMEYSGALYSGSDGSTAVQVEDLTLTPFHMSTAQEDLTMFWDIDWKPLLPTLRLGREFTRGELERNRKIAMACQRLSLYYFRRLDKMTSINEFSSGQSEHLKYMLEFARLTLTEIRLGLQPNMQAEWLLDDEERISEVAAQFPESIDIQVIRAIGEAYPSIFGGQRSALDVLLEEDRLMTIYRHGLGFTEGNTLLAEVVQTLSRRSSGMKILEVGAGTGSATELILPSGSYSSYVFTDISPAFLGPAEEKFMHHSAFLSFQIYDLEKDPVDQGLKLNSFDIVVASDAIHAVSDVRATLARIRSLLRPGGYLACLELTSGKQTRNTLMLGCLPGWWMGHGKDRMWSPALTESQWDQYLRETGFSGLDAVDPMDEELIFSSHVWYSQAVDPRILSLRAPLSAPCQAPRESLMIIGGGSLPLEIVNGLQELLSPSFRNTTRVASLDDVTGQTDIPYAILSLVELENPIFSGMSDERWSALRRLFSEATDVLWITTGIRCPKSVDAIYASMMLGLARTVRHELRHLRLQIFDLDDAASATAERIAEAMIRWHMLGNFATEGWKDDILCGHHPELTVNEGEILFPSVQHTRARNDRYNSQHRRIMQDVKPQEDPTELVYNTDKETYQLCRLPQFTTELKPDGEWVIKMIHSTLFSFRIKGIGFTFLGLGEFSNGSLAIVLSDRVCSILWHSSKTIVYRPGIELPRQTILRTVTARILTARVIEAAGGAGTLLVLCSDALWLSTIQLTASESGKIVKFLTSNPALHTNGASCVLHNITDFMLQQRIPQDVSAIFNLSNQRVDEMLFDRISSLVRERPVKLKGANSFFRPRSFYTADELQSSEGGMTFVRALLKSNGPPWEEDDLCTISAQETVDSQVHSCSAILDWTAASKISISKQLATYDVRFSPSKTYLIVGSSDVARSICEWMCSQGGKYFVMASRNISHLKDWAEEMTAKSAIVKLHSMDVTNEDSVNGMLQAVKADTDDGAVAMPPIAGVMHLGLVLRDRAFSTMSFEDLQAVTNVKAEGSLILHKKLLHEQLDFFVLTSSLSYIIGNAGQSNYNCGNAFMVGLANYRRSIGLPASVIHLGVVTGIGYMTRNVDAKYADVFSEHLRKNAYAISERDLHQIFAEAILGGSVESDLGPEIITGLMDIGPDAIEQSTWASEPMFGRVHSSHLSAPTNNARPQLSFRDQLREALNSSGMQPSDPESGAFRIVHSAFVNKLKVLLQMNDIDDNVSVIDFGIDSLVASEISSWARKEFRTVIPNSTVFGGANVKDLAAIAIKGIDMDWVLDKRPEI